MYDIESITSLSESVGFGETIDESINLDDSNEKGSSGIIFKSYHQLVTVDAMLSTFKEEISNSSKRFNAELSQIRLDAAKKVLVDVLDSHIDFLDSTDYSSIIITKLNLLRPVFGLAVVITCIEMMISSGRYNIEERTVRQTYAALKLELEGAKNTQGQTVSQGIVSKYRYAVKKARKVIFQVRPEVQEGEFW